MSSCSQPAFHYLEIWREGLQVLLAMDRLRTQVSFQGFIKSMSFFLISVNSDLPLSIAVKILGSKQCEESYFSVSKYLKITRNNLKKYY